MTLYYTIIAREYNYVIVQLVNADRNCKYLGIKMCSDMKWKIQVLSVTGK